MSQEGTRFKEQSGPNANSSTWISNLLSKSARPKNQRRIGLEVERLAVWNDLTPFLYRDSNLHPGAETLLKELASRLGWKVVNSPSGNDLVSHVIGLKPENGSVSLEPGSQVEISLDPTLTLLESRDQIDAFERTVKEVTDPWGLFWIGLGVNPLHKVGDIDLIPSPRYAMMTDYFGGTGRYGTAMMRLTTSVQVNLDYSDEREAIEMLRVALCAAPISYLLFSNSPFFEKKKSEYLSFRSQIWRETDRARAGLLPEAFDTAFGFREYADYLWRQPLMFAQDSANGFIPAYGNSLIKVSKETAPSFPINENNQWNALRELFTEARLKPGYIEVRSIDGLLPTHRYAAAAFWTGLLYGEEVRKMALKLLGGLTRPEKDALWTEISRFGFRAKFQSLKIIEIASELLKGAHATLKSRGFGEEVLLSPAFEILEERRSPGASLLERYNGDWNGNFEKVIEATRFA